MVTRTRFQFLITAATVAGLAATVVVSSASAGPHPPDPGVVRVDSGWLRGSVAADHVRYSGIPYAAPPVGERRWQPPARPQSWSGVRDATALSPYCPQAGPEGLAGQEDCLYLDVTVPAGARPGDRLPVLVWLHGGGFNTGGGREQRGGRLAAAGEMVVVTINYRLGALGFLATPELEADGGNFGLMDQAAALRWVRRNAAHFGGDPHNVTLAGQSAGARAVCAQLASPGARGLFHRAILQSGACDNRVPALAEAYEFGARATEELGCASATDVATCLRQRTPAELLGTLENVGWDVNGRVSDRPWGPVAGTPVLPEQPGEALRNGSAARVPLLIGGTRDEMRSFVSGQAALTEREYHTMLTETFGDQAGAVLAEYPVAGDRERHEVVGSYDSPALALAAVLSDWGGSIGACPVLRTAVAASAHQPVYAYEFAEDSGQITEDGYPMGSYHGLDLPYLWDLELAWNPYPELIAEQEKLSVTLIAYWSAFAHTGNPNDVTPGGLQQGLDGSDRPYWPEFGSANTVIELSTDGIAPTAYAENHRCGFWNGFSR